MEKAQEEVESGSSLLDGNNPGVAAPHRYSKEELLIIKERPHSRQRPPCLLDKYDSDGVWDPEKWHASLYPNSGRSSPVVDPLKKDLESERTSLKRRITDPRERLKEEELDVVLSPQRRSFGGGCHVTAVVGSRRAGSPLENKENENLRILGSRRIGSGRIVSVRAFERDPRGVEKDVRDSRDGRERDYKDKRFRRDYGDSKRVFGERRRNDSYTEEEPEWYSAGPTSQSETIELIGFDDKILEEDPKGRKRTRRRTISLKEGFECNGVAEVDEAEVCIRQDAAADQEVPQEVVLPEPAPGEFDFNEFFNLDKSVPGLASMIEDVLGEGSVSSSRFSRWFSNPSRSVSRSSSQRSTPHEELERLAGLENLIPSPGQHPGNYFAPIQFEENSDNKVDILEMLQKAKVDLKPLLSSLTANKEKLKESSECGVLRCANLLPSGSFETLLATVPEKAHSGVVLSVEEVEAGLKGLKVEQEQKIATPFMAEQLEEALTAMTGPRQPKKDGDMSAFNKLVSSMKQSQENNLSHGDVTSNHLHRNILQELLGPPLTRPISSNALTGLMGALDPAASLLAQRSQAPHMSNVFPGRASSADYLRPRVSPPLGFQSGPQQLVGDRFQNMRKPMSPVNSQVSHLEYQQAALEGLLLPHDLSLNAANFYQSSFGKMQMDQCRDGYRRPQRMNRSPVLSHKSSSPAPSSCITSMLSPSFTPTSVIRKMYESREKSKDESAISKSTTSDEDGIISGSIANTGQSSSPVVGNKYSASQGSACSTPLSQNNRYTKDQDFRPKSMGRKTPTMESPVPGAPFLRPVQQVPVPSHVPIVRPQLHPGLVQRMLAQGVHPQQLPPLLQTGMLPPGLDLSHLQGLSTPMLGQQFYQLPTPGHPLLNPRNGNPLQLAMMQQHLQRTGSGSHSAHAHLSSRSGLPLMHSQMDLRHRSTSPVGLSKWFGSDVLQQPLPSMPAKVITVDELEYRQ
ncbi:eukaryotic translation initiation factor 4E transporter isoform X2 [Ambystoma mexicanum]|uniref:eukaryotic translation initiation factor 4E transporter isoform X2 n=1 Tax=Ambystoma mexicanum TaxID=8296 RepID=UPI0037E99B48